MRDEPVMKVLIISHTVISQTNNMGKTIRSYFQGFAPSELAQIYIHSEVPTDDSVCHNYFRFTDQDALKSILRVRKYGTVFTDADIDHTRISTRTDAGITAEIYNFGRRRNAQIYFARNTLWQLACWKTNRLKKWIEDFAPDMVFFMAGDYEFMYDVALYAAELTGKPLAVCCVDDFYLHNKLDSAFGRYVYRKFMKKVHALMQRASCIFTISELMGKEYQKKFGKPTCTLHTSVPQKQVPQQDTADKISYIGNIGGERYLQLVQIGRALKAMHREQEPRLLDVYSAETKQNILAEMTPENGIRFHGKISADEVLQVMAGSMAVIHTESFSEKGRNAVRYSVSTKIPESLMYGPCLLAYGPEDVASICYLKENRAAFVITGNQDLRSELEKFLANPQLRKDILRNARELAQRNHDGVQNAKKLRLCLDGIVNHSGEQT